MPPLDLLIAPSVFRIVGGIAFSSNKLSWNRADEVLMRPTKTSQITSRHCFD